MKTKLVVMWLLLIMAATLGLFGAYKLVLSDYNLYVSESACVAGLVRLGVERHAIETGNGTCWRK